jgi:mannose-6-phosphate isomerase-like protein (cupin superfamily)
MSNDDQKREYYFREGCFVTELSNSKEDPQLSIAHIRVEAGETTRWHKLLGTTERYLILGGRGLVELGDQPALEVSEGDIIFIQPEVAQRISNTGNNDLVFLALCTPRFQENAYIDLED